LFSSSWDSFLISLLKVAEKKHVLPPGGEHFEDLLDILDKTHVQHPVRLVENQNLHLGKIQGLLIQMVDEPPRGGHHDIQAPADFIDLGADLDPPEDGRRFQGQEGAVIVNTLENLGRQLPGGAEDEGPGGPEALSLVILKKVLQQGQGEGGGFTGSGLGAPHYVFSFQDGKDGLGLYGGGQAVPFLFQGLKQFRP
jgi:hypothetical protein